MAWPGRSLESVLKRWVETHPVSRTPHHSYQYKPLRGDGKETVRLMILFPAATPSDPLVCCLIERAFTGFSHEALSYAWGDMTENRPIYCAVPGKDEYGRLDITRSLDEALRALRKRHGVRSIWVDAVCIDQQDSHEKLQQISLMADIFSRASQTLIWLGDSDGNTARLFKTYQRHHLLKKLSPEAAKNYINKYGDDSIEKNERIVRADHALRSRPWFYRLWTLQELLLSSDPLVVCGTYSIRWTCIAETDSLNEFRGELPKRSNCTTSFATLKALPRDYASYAGHYGDLVANVKQLHTSEPRDKVIGNKSILSDAGLCLPPLDYSTSVANVFVAATRMWLRHTKSLGLVYLAVTGRSTRGLPSWAIDWNHTSIKDRDIFMYWINVRRDDQPQIMSDGTTRSGTEQDEQSRSAFDFHLGVRGIIVDKVSSFIAGASDSTDRTHMVYAMITWLKFMFEAQSHADMPSAVEQAVALIPIECEDFDVPTHIAVGVINHKAMLIDPTLASIPYDEPKHSTIKYNDFFIPDDALEVPIRKPRDVMGPMYRLELKMKNETLLMTEAGRLGFCFCENMEKGDVVAILVGAEYPVILREAGLPGQYLFVGPATVYEMMEGELWPENLNDLTDFTLV
ncbi:hypothetical protein M409DRAFT_26443 [Zasmidium cellare ATCC 36951]|uniref:Heterokaryon incompatibility domain-containing protein n=1 Tax=Zasmidium cellare ATCC 36951 TaxID=1080233 RepID=A0A6A6C7H5_ZASCE|nr:uncharacterized protein M409DRAFT_26443 [Zasmidium cellare ATCC 36951]KAF2162995.1 hypothetical protein M409DRAFT_26443 [Zasmidium cellare ATCC 36951]